MEVHDTRGTERSIHMSVVKFRWVQDVFEPTKSDDDRQPERGNTDSGKTTFDPGNTEMMVSTGNPDVMRGLGNVGRWLWRRKERVHTHHGGSRWTTNGIREERD